MVALTPPRSTNDASSPQPTSYGGPTRKARIIPEARQIGALAVAALIATSTVNSYRPPAHHGNPSVWFSMFDLVVTEVASADTGEPSAGWR